MKKKYYILLIILICCSCIQDKKNNIERIVNFPYSVLTDSIYTRMPGQLFHSNKYIVWVDPFSSNDLVHVLDAFSGKELGSLGSIGNGPNEFTDFDAFLTYDSLIGLYDLNKDLQGYIDLDLVRADSSNAFVRWTHEKLGYITHFLEIDKDSYLLLYPGASKPFIYKHDGEVDSIGKFPLEEKILNGFNHYQGAMLYNPIRKSLFYSTRHFPYAASYKLDNGKWILDWEKQEPMDYQVINNKLKLENSRTLFHEATLSKDYIVFAKRDEEKYGKLSEKEEEKLDRTKRLPRSLFLYDYDFNLKKIVELDAPIIRLAGDVHSNTLYAIIVNPEYSIIKLDLPE